MRRLVSATLRKGGRPRGLPPRHPHTADQREAAIPTRTQVTLCRERHPNSRARSR